MKIRLDRSENVLRSVGDWPNGIVTILQGTDAVTLAISHSYEPPKGPRPSGVNIDLEQAPGSTPEEAGVHLVATRELVAACDDTAAATAYVIVAGAFVKFAEYALERAQPELIAPWFELLVELRDAVAERAAQR